MSKSSRIVGISVFLNFVLFVLITLRTFVFVPPDEKVYINEIKGKIAVSSSQKQLQAQDLKAENLLDDRGLEFEEFHRYIHNLTGYKENGTFIQSLVRSTNDRLSPGSYLADNFNWKGFIIEPDFKKYNQLHHENILRPNVHVLDSCIAYNDAALSRRKKRSPRGGGRGGGRMGGGRRGKLSSISSTNMASLAAIHTGSRIFWWSNAGGYTRSHNHKSGLSYCYSLDIILQGLDTKSCDLFMLGGYGKEIYVGLLTA